MSWFAGYAVGTIVALIGWHAFVQSNKRGRK